MGQIVVTGAKTMCIFGTAPGNLMVTSNLAALFGGKPAATIQDCTLASMTPFGMCISLANPQVAAATAAALGVLVPQPCMMMPAGTWIPTTPQLIIGGKPCLTSDCKLLCANGLGLISITDPGQFKIVTP